MLINVRDSQGKLRAKDIFDLDFDMYVSKQKDTDKFVVAVNPSYYLDGTFDSEKEAEDALYKLVQDRNDLEDELRWSNT